MGIFAFLTSTRSQKEEEEEENFLEEEGGGGDFLRRLVSLSLSHLGQEILPLSPKIWNGLYASMPHILCHNISLIGIGKLHSSPGEEHYV